MSRPRKQDTDLLFEYYKKSLRYGKFYRKRYKVNKNKLDIISKNNYTYYKRLIFNKINELCLSYYFSKRESFIRLYFDILLNDINEYKLDFISDYDRESCIYILSLLYIDYYMNLRISKKGKKLTYKLPSKMLLTIW